MNTALGSSSLASSIDLYFFQNFKSPLANRCASLDTATTLGMFPSVEFNKSNIRFSRRKLEKWLTTCKLWMPSINSISNPIAPAFKIIMSILSNFLRTLSAAARTDTNDCHACDQFSFKKLLVYRFSCARINSIPSVLGLFSRIFWVTFLFLNRLEYGFSWGTNYSNPCSTSTCLVKLYADLFSSTETIRIS